MNALNQVSTQVVLTPAYGRVYDSQKLMLKDWTEGKDFKVFNGPYVSIRDSAFLQKDASSVALTQDFYTYTIV